jgi:hypothetical protein
MTTFQLLKTTIVDDDDDQEEEEDILPISRMKYLSK